MNTFVTFDQFKILLYEQVDKLKRRGLPAELHHVQTEDGYIVGIHRIPKYHSAPNYRGVMFLMHGLSAASPCFLVYPNISAGYYFWKAGYDVWLGNARGTEYSRNHTTLSPENVDFWKFSWHEIGYYDLPAMIDYSLKTAKQAKLVYIGHSQGVTSAMVMLSARPEYNKKIKILHAMSVPVIMQHHSIVYSDFFMGFLIDRIHPVLVR